MQVRRYRRGRGHRVRQPEMKRKLGRFGKCPQQNQHQRHRIERIGADLLSRGEDHVERKTARDVTQHDDARQQAQATCTGDHQCHARTLPRIGAMTPETDQQKRREAGQFPEHDQQDQVVGQHNAQHRPHECHEIGKEARRRIGGAQVIVCIQDDQCTDRIDDAGEGPRQSIHAESERYAGKPRNAGAQDVAGKDRRAGQPEHHAARQCRQAGDPRHRFAGAIGK